jgi:hypothetical protein
MGKTLIPLFGVDGLGGEFRPGKKKSGTSQWRDVP